MKAVLNEVFCMEWELGREIVLDENRTFSIEIHVGPEDSNVSESFTVTVCNVDFVRKVIDRNGVFNSMWHLVLSDPSKEIISQYYAEIVSKIEGNTWADCVSRLRLIGRHEFENYQA